MSWDAYHSPRSIEDALGILESYQGRAIVVAGGTDLLLDLRRGGVPADCLVDITRIDALKRIELEGDHIIIGASVTHAEVAASALIRERAAALAQATGQMGSPQIRNQATLLGNLIRALPAADGAVALAALDAEVEVTGTGGARWQPMAALYAGVGCCTVDCRREIATRLRFRGLGEGEGSAFLRLVKRRSLALPMVNAAAAVSVGAGRIQYARLAVAPVAPAPYRSTRAEEFLKGQNTSAKALDRAARLAAEDARPRDHWLRGSAEYRCQMVRVMARRALENAVAAAWA